MSFLVPRAALLSRRLIAPQSLQRRKLSIAHRIPSYAPRMGLKFLLWSITGGLCLAPLWFQYYQGRMMYYGVGGFRIAAQCCRSQRLYPSVNFDSFRSAIDHYRDLIMPVMLLSDSRASVNELFDAVIEWQTERVVDEEQLTQLHNICREASREVYGMLEARPVMTLEMIEKLHLVLLASMEEMTNVFYAITRVTLEKQRLEQSRQAPNVSDWETKM